MYFAPHRRTILHRYGVGGKTYRRKIGCGARHGGRLFSMSNAIARDIAEHSFPDCLVRWYRTHQDYNVGDPKVYGIDVALDLALAKALALPESAPARAGKNGFVQRASAADGGAGRACAGGSRSICSRISSIALRAASRPSAISSSAR
jgi:hypothetical protein